MSKKHYDKSFAVFSKECDISQIVKIVFDSVISCFTHSSLSNFLNTGIDKTVTDGDIRDIAMNSDLLHKDMMKLFMELEMKQPEIEKAQRNADTTDVQIRSVHILQDWRQKSGKSATRRRILEALKRCKLIDAKEILEDIWST